MDLLGLPSRAMMQFIMSAQPPPNNGAANLPYEDINNGPAAAPAPAAPPANAPGLRQRRRAGSPPAGAAAANNAPPPPVRPIPVRAAAAAGVGVIPPGGAAAAPPPPAAAAPPPAAAPREPFVLNAATFYTMLNVPQNATDENIKKSYRKKSLRAHPNRGGDVATFQQLQQAYEILSNPEKRVAYNHALSLGATHQRAAEIASIDPTLDIDAVAQELRPPPAAQGFYGYGYNAAGAAGYGGYGYNPYGYGRRGGRHGRRSSTRRPQRHLKKQSRRLRRK
jgi:hypothetical protein